MARPRKPARLWLHPTERVWIILDRGAFIRTGFVEARIREAETALNEYLGGKFTPRKRVSDPNALPIAEVLTAYATEHAPNLKSRQAIGNDLSWLEPFFGDKYLSDIAKDTCLGYAEWRRKQGKWPGDAIRKSDKSVSNGTIRRELAILSAAIGYWHATHGPLSAVPVVTLPPIPPGRDKFLERADLVRLLAGSLGFYQEHWSDVATRQEHARWRRDRAHINRHLTRFILLGVATGSRKAVLLGARWMPNTVSGWIDLDKEIFHRRALDEIETKKRKPPSALGPHILAHLRRWKRIDSARRAAHIAAGGDARLYQTIIHFNGAEMVDVKTSWRAACELGGLGDGYVRHTLRHTRATMLMRAGVPIWEAAGQLGMSAKLLDDRYGHHNPKFQQQAARVR